jgi:hypothetical protein
MTTCSNDKVYLELMRARTPNDQNMIQNYNCSNYKMSYPNPILSMLPPNKRASFSGISTLNFDSMYQLNPDKESIKMAGLSSSNNNKYPPSCGFDQTPPGLCRETPGGYYNLASAYNPMSGSKCVNYGQDLNLQYMNK